MRHRRAYRGGRRNRYGAFERHTRGFGSRILRRYGWTEGGGVGRTPGAAEAIEPRTQLDTAGLGYGPDDGKRKRKRKATAAPRPRHDEDDEDEDDNAERGGVRSAFVLRPATEGGAPTPAALVHAEQLRRWRIANDPSYVSINTVYDHPRTNPLLPLAYYDDADADDGEAEKKKTKQKSEDEATSWRPYAFPTKPFVRGGTIEEEREALKRADGGMKGCL
jgi:hypothetical protein